MPIQEGSLGFHPYEPSEHDFDHGEFDESNGACDVTLIVLGQATAVADPSEGSLDDPAFWQDGKALLCRGSLDDSQRGAANFGQSCR